jgi:translation initiation factor IF-1
MSQDKLEFDGEVIDASKGIFKVKVNESHTVTCTMSGKIRINAVKILVGDIVHIEASPYDTSKGRITFRHPPKKSF